MSTNKHIDKICIAAVCLMLILTALFMNGRSLGIIATANSMKYESTLFDTSYVHSIDIVMDDWDSFIENCENEDYASCTVVIDGKQHKNTAIRAKGNTSLSSVRSLGSQRYSFKLEFDHYEDGKSCDELDKLCLNNLIQDNTMMKDYIAYTLMNDFGVDGPLCSFAYITVNGEDWGLYLAVEGIEDSFLQRNYGSDTGELYKPDSMSFGGGRGNGKDVNMDDFDFGGSASEQADSDAAQLPDNAGRADSSRPPEGSGEGFGGKGTGGEGFGGKAPGREGFGAKGPGEKGPGGEGPGEKGFDGKGPGGMGSEDVKLQYIDDDPDSYENIFDSAKTDVSKADKKRLISALKNLSQYTDLENTLDTDEVLRYFVVHNFLVNGDSYTGNMIHNYYLHEKDGKLGMIPWDYNLAFGTFMGGNASGSINDSIDEVLSDRPMQAWIFSDEAYTAQYHALYSEFIEKWFADGKLEKLISDTAELIRPYVEKDPTRFCTTEEFETGVQTMQQFASLRAEAVSRQLAGDTTAVETGDLKLSAMGSMGGNHDDGKMSPGGEHPSRNEGDNGDLPPDAGVHSAGNDSGHGGGEASFGKPSGAADLPTWGLVGISVAVLAAGILIAVKKKW